MALQPSAISCSKYVLLFFLFESYGFVRKGHRHHTLLEMLVVTAATSHALYTATDRIAAPAIRTALEVVAHLQLLSPCISLIGHRFDGIAVVAFICVGRICGIALQIQVSAAGTTIVALVGRKGYTNTEFATRLKVARCKNRP